MNTKQQIHAIIQQLVTLYNSLSSTKKLSIQAHFNDEQYKDKEGKYIIYDKVVGVLEDISEDEG